MTSELDLLPLCGQRPFGNLGALCIQFRPALDILGTLATNWSLELLHLYLLADIGSIFIVFRGCIVGGAGGFSTSSNLW